MGQCCHNLWSAPLSRRRFLAGTSLIFGGAAFRQPLLANNAPSVKIGYLPITDSAPLIVAHSKQYFLECGLDADEPRLFRSWSSLIEAFLARQINVAHLLMPIPIWLRYAQRVPVKIVAWNHTNGSAITVGKHIERLDDLAGRTVAVPFWYSTHNMILQHALRHRGLEPVVHAKPKDTEVGLVVMAPPEMPIALSRGSISGYIVADPFNAQAEIAGIGRILRFSGDIWAEHGDCVVVMHEDDLALRARWSGSVVHAITQAHLWTRSNREEAAQRLTRYLPHQAGILRRILLDEGRLERVINREWEPNPWIDFKPYPFPSYTELVVKLLSKTWVEGERDFLKTLNPAKVHLDLVEDEPVLTAIKTLGGPSVFDLPADLHRQERLEGWSST